MDVPPPRIASIHRRNPWVRCCLLRVRPFSITARRARELRLPPPAPILGTAMNQLSPSLLDAATDLPVMVGFSGGLDSTALLHLLANASARAPGTLRAVHV